MNDWPDAQPEGPRRMRHVQRPQVPPQQPYPQQHEQQQYGQGHNQARGQGRDEGYHPSFTQAQVSGYDSGYSSGQVYGGPQGPGRGPGGPGGPGTVPPQYSPPRTGGGAGAPDWRRRIKIGSIVLAVAVVGWSVGTYAWASSKMRNEVDLSKVIERPSEGDCTTYLIVGSDSREGMTAEEKKKLHTGSAEGKRTDSMMILAACSSGNTMVSLPRDSWVTIPSFVGSESGKKYPARGGAKLNAAYAMDGPELLVRTVEFNTGLRIDHYAEIGFAGFANIVDALGGVELNIEKGFKDKKSGADFQAGTQTLNGEQALAFVRTRYAFAESDLARTKNQQKFLSALASQAATPGTILNPFKLYPTLGAGLDTLIVDKDMSLYDLATMFFAMKGISSGGGTSMNMPIAGSAPQGSLKWDMPKVKQLVEQIRNDEKVTVTSNR
ncbi:LCP family protein [Streptomyces roseicoloratus]|uniref:LCP family protein n=1 Tax=Streptomyces roseicoloratus TaxID=2508722 RepID=A0ABY9RYX8_9ACTN|nr:LCP family protein [Streptomyces roseicoloratus]WMX46711.1 LCP family protein [Streptomyces roseicoloratus]